MKKNFIKSITALLLFVPLFTLFLFVSPVFAADSDVQACENLTGDAAKQCMTSACADQNSLTQAGRTACDVYTQTINTFPECAAGKPGDVITCSQGVCSRNTNLTASQQSACGGGNQSSQLAGCETWKQADYDAPQNQGAKKEACEYVRDNILPFAPTDDYFVATPVAGGWKGVLYGENSTKFCSYYAISEEENLRLAHAYNQFEVRQMCMLGYETGFGKNKVCNDNYLRRFRVDYSKDDAGDNKYQRDRLRKLEAARVRACQDGYTQYVVDYWSCDGNKSCQDALRNNPQNRFNPGDPPKRQTTTGSTINPTKAIPGLVTLNNAGNDKKCGSVYTAYFVCTLSDDPENTGLWQTLQTILNILLTLVTVAAVGGLAYGGMRYSASRDDPGELNEAKNFIRNVVIGLVIFILMWAIIEYVIPGGIISQSTV